LNDSVAKILGEPAGILDHYSDKELRNQDIWNYDLRRTLDDSQQKGLAVMMKVGPPLSSRVDLHA